MRADCVWLMILLTREFPNLDPGRCGKYWPLILIFAGAGMSGTARAVGIRGAVHVSRRHHAGDGYFLLVLLGLIWQGIRMPRTNGPATPQ